MQARFMLVLTHITIIVYGYDMCDLNVPTTGGIQFAVFYVNKPFLGYIL